MTDFHTPQDLLGQLDHSKLVNLLGYLLAQASVQTNKIFDTQVARPLQLTQLEFSILVLVHCNPGTTSKQLAQALATVPARMSLLLDRLDGRSLICREQSVVDKRFQHLTLSNSGVALVNKALSISTTMEEALLRHLTRGERTVLMELLWKVAMAGRKPE